MVTRVNRVAIGVVAAAAALTLTVGVLSFAPAGSAFAEDYPSWDEVNAAKQNASSKQNEVDRITRLLGDLENRAAVLGDEAVRKGAEYLQATYAYEAARQQADTLKSQADDASAKADSANKQLGQLAAQLYRNGGNAGGLGILTSGDDSSRLLYQLGTMSKLTERSSDLSASASTASNVAASIGAQAQVAAAERDRLASEAATRLAEAKAAQAAADKQVADTKATSDVLYAQLATLKNTSAQVEQQYRAGVAAREAEAAEAAERARQAGSTPPGSGWTPPGAAVADPSSAKAYAQSQMGPHGWGSGEFDCLLKLWTRESGWRVNAYNASSGAYGIPQSLPGSKMASAGSDWQTNAATQINWGLSYISGRYGSPCGAWAHSEATNWY